MVTALTSRCNEPLVYENRRVLWLIKMNVCLTNCQYSPVFALTGLLRPSHASLSSYLQGKGEVASVDRLTDPICQAITSGRVPRRLSPSVTTQWNKYALAPVCVSPQRFYHRSSRARSLCKLLSVKKAQGKRKKNREGWSWGGIEEALSKHLRSDKSISVFNRVEEMCGRCGARGWESAKHRVESVTERLSGDKWSTTQSYYVDSSKIPHKYSDTASPPTSLQTFHFFKMLAAARLADMS